MHTVLSNSSSGRIKLSIEPFMEEIEPVVEKYEFEFVVIKNNIKSKNYRILRILLPKWKQRISKEVLPYKCNVSGWDPDVRKRTRVTDENEFEFRERTIMKAFFFFENSDCQHSGRAGNEINEFWNAKFLYS